MRRHERRFWFKLAANLGMSVRRAQSEISSTEFVEWMILADSEPMEPDRTDWRFALLTSEIAGLFSKERTKPADYLIRFKSKKSDPEEIEKENKANLSWLMNSARQWRNK